MKTLRPEGRRKAIHPSPPATSTDALAVLSLLPAAVLALTAALGFEDREVLAYLITRSLGGQWVAEEEEEKGARRHGAAFGCGCFECYTRFWCRWDASPDRELIHRAIEAFEERLPRGEKVACGGRRRRRREKGRKGKGRRKVVEEVAGKVVEEEEVQCDVDRGAAEDEEEQGKGGGGGEWEVSRRWPDVTWLFTCRFWRLWSPGI